MPTGLLDRSGDTEWGSDYRTHLHPHSAQAQIHEDQANNRRFDSLKYDARYPRNASSLSVSGTVDPGEQDGERAREGLDNREPIPQTAHRTQGRDYPEDEG